MHIGEHRHADLARTRASALQPRLDAGAAEARREERLALSKEDLKMNGMPSAAVISRSRPATSMTSASLSMTQGPAIRKSGRSEADLESRQFHAVGAPGLQRRAILARGSDEPREQRMAVARRGGELRVELARHEPRMRRQFDEFDQPIRAKIRKIAARQPPNSSR